MSNREWRPLKGYVQTHCSMCKGGWTRRNETGLAIVFCLLERQQVLDDMTSCEKFDRDHNKAAPV